MDFHDSKWAFHGSKNDFHGSKNDFHDSKWAFHGSSLAVHGSISAFHDLNSGHQPPSRAAWSVRRLLNLVAGRLGETAVEPLKLNNFLIFNKIKFYAKEQV